MPTGLSPGDNKDSKDNNAAEPVRVLPALRALMSGIPQAPIPAQIELASEQVMLGGRPLQDIAAELHGDGKSWSVRKLDFRAPGTTRVSLSEADAQEAVRPASSRPRSMSNRRIRTR